MEPPQVSLWASFCICFAVFGWDYWNRCQSITYSALQKRLNVVSFLVMMMIMLDIIKNLFFCHSFFCESINFQKIPTEALTATLISLYQVTRLHYSFNNELNHLNWRSIHRILYIIPLLWLIYMITIDQIRFTIKFTENETCVFVRSVTPPVFWVLSSIAAFRYAYDCFVVYIYVNRVQTLVNYNHQTAESKCGKTAENIATRMLILTVVIVIITIIHCITNITYTQITNNLQFQIIVYTFDCVQRVVVCFCVFLMLRHNTITYQNFIKSNCWSNCLIVGKNSKNGKNHSIAEHSCGHIWNKIPLIYMPSVNGSNTDTVMKITSDNSDSSSSSLNLSHIAPKTKHKHKIRNINANSIFPRFDLDEKYIKQSQRIFIILMKLKIHEISIPEVATIISEYAPTTYAPCVECGKTFGYVDCCYDYFIVNCALANCDPTQNDAIRYYLNGDGSFSTNIQNDINHYDEQIDVLCVECGEEWQCNVCETQFCSFSYDSILINGGCDLCSNVTCQDCSTVFKDKVVCFNCYPSKTSNYNKSKSYQTLTLNTSISNLKSITKKSLTSKVNESSLNSRNNNSNTNQWGSFNFSTSFNEHENQILLCAKQIQ